MPSRFRGIFQQRQRITVETSQWRDTEVHRSPVPAGNATRAAYVAETKPRTCEALGQRNKRSKPLTGILPEPCLYGRAVWRQL